MPPNGSPRILIYDLETAPLLGYAWGQHEVNIIHVVKEPYILCAAWKWYGEKRIHVATMEGDEDDRNVVAKLHELFNEADIIIAHNGDRYDQPVSHAMFIRHGFLPPEPYRQVDTLKVARKHFRFSSNRLNELGKVLGLGEKAQTGGFRTWLGCMDDDPAAWRKMVRYNRQDVALLEKVYEKLLPWITTHPAVNNIAGRPEACPKCLAEGQMQARGWLHLAATKRRRYQCKACGGWTTDRNSVRTHPEYVNAS